MEIIKVLNPNDSNWTVKSEDTIPAEIVDSCTDKKPFKNLKRYNVRTYNSTISLRGFDSYSLIFELSNFDIKANDFAFISILGKTGQYSGSEVKWHDFQINAGHDKEGKMLCSNNLNENKKGKVLKNKKNAILTDIFSLFHDQDIKIRLMIEADKSSNLSSYVCKSITIMGDKLNGFQKILNFFGLYQPLAPPPPDGNPPDGTTGPRKPPGE